ncbi:MAG: hypothetical protein MZW92_16220 [Comamonadaceae bacterium]|nr:hypothetical protein [Comamonadaceae bacterium]
MEGVAGFYSFFCTEPARPATGCCSRDNITDRMLGSQALMDAPVPAACWRRARARSREDGLVSVGTDLLHRPVRPGPGAAGQPAPGDHAARRGARRRRSPS